MLKNLTMLDQVAKSNITKWSIQGHMIQTCLMFYHSCLLKWKLQFVTSPWCTPLWVLVSEQEWQRRAKETQFLVLFLTQDRATDTSATICPQEEHCVSNLMPCFWIFTFTAFIPFWLAVLREAASSPPEESGKSFWHSGRLRSSTGPLDFLCCSAVSQLCTWVLHKQEGKISDRDLHVFVVLEYR